jgi:uncharacterized membrane protein YjfL (UPF0719 family)
MDWGRVTAGLYLVVFGIVEFLMQTRNTEHDLFHIFVLGVLGLLLATVVAAAIILIF